MTTRALPPRPDLGRFTMSVGFLLRPDAFLDDCRAACGDSFTLRPAPDREVVFTCDPEAVRQVFTADPGVVHAGEGNVVLAPLLGSGSILLLDGAEHMRHRRLLLPPFHGERMRAHVDAMTEVAERHISSWPRGRAFPVLPSVQAITLEIILRVVFGVDDPTRRERLGVPLRRLLDTVATRRRVVALALTQSRTGRGTPWGRFLALREEAVALLREEIDAHRRSAVEDRGDVLSLLLAAQDDEGRPLTDGELVDELLTLLVAGHETTANAIAWTLERLVRHPEWTRRLTAEARDDGATGEEMDAVITETLRLRPVVPAVVRRLTAPMRLGSWDLPAGTNVAPSIYLLHRRGDLYPDPTAFRPERFLDGERPGTYTWIPFGGGVRRCLGASFALTEMRAVLRTVLLQAPPRAAGGRRGTVDEGTIRRAITFAPARGGRVVVG